MLQPAAEVGFDGVLRGAHDPRDFLIGKLFKVAQDNGLALRRGKVFKSAVDQGVVVAKRRRSGGGFKAGQFLGEFQPDGFFFALLPVEIAHLRQRDAVQPGGKRFACPPEAPEIFQGGQKRLRRQILGDLHVAGAAEQVAIDAVNMAIVKNAVGLRVIFGLFDQGGFVVPIFTLHISTS